MEKNLSQTTTNIRKVAFIGPECTGKTTLCTHLAKYFQTEWTPEFMRIYLQEKWDKTRKTCTWDDLLPIAYGQMELENQITKKANKILFCDTNLLEITIYSYIYYQKCPTEIETFALKNTYDFIFLTDIDVPWQADDLRDKPNEREEVLDFFKKYLIKNNINFIPLKGTLEQKIQQIINKITSLNFTLVK